MIFASVASSSRVTGYSQAKVAKFISSHWRHGDRNLLRLEMLVTSLSHSPWKYQMNNRNLSTYFI